MMNVYDFCFLCTEPRMTDVALYDLSESCEAPGKIVFRGKMDEAARSQYSKCEVCSYDMTDEGLTLNIDTSED